MFYTNKYFIKQDMGGRKIALIRKQNVIKPLMKIMILHKNKYIKILKSKQVNKYLKKIPKHLHFKYFL